MTSTRSILIRIALACGVLVGAAGAGAWYVDGQLPRGQAVAQGLQLAGHSGADSGTPEAFVRPLQAQLDRPIALRLDGKELFRASARELGGHIDIEALQRAAQALGRDGDWSQRYDDARLARAGKRALAAPLQLPADALIQRLLPIKQRYDQAASSARWDFINDTATQHVDGRLLDVYATVEAFQQAAERGEDNVDVVVQQLPPRATQALVAAIDRSQVVNDYTTRFGFVGNQVGRAQNVARAAAGINGLVMMPGEVLSFNALVGPRSIDNGFAQAGEIYKGEMRVGVGGGTCQVASTFHAAAYLGGLEVVERSPHSRPSGYIGVGLDATVAYPHVDLRMKNPFDFPVVVQASAHKGVMRVVLYGERRPATVDFAASTVGIKRYKRKIRTAHWLKEGKTFRKQKGRRGMTIEKVRRIHYAGGETRVETTTDTYPPTNEVYYVAPGTDTDTALPPLPEDASG